jgi:hypothetical protein
MTKILIIAAVIDLDDPDEPQEQPVPEPKPAPQDAFLRQLVREVRKEYHPDFWKDINGTFFKAVFYFFGKTGRA